MIDIVRCVYSIPDKVSILYFNHIKCTWHNLIITYHHLVNKLSCNFFRIKSNNVYFEKVFINCLISQNRYSQYMHLMCIKHVTLAINTKAIYIIFFAYVFLIFHTSPQTDYWRVSFCGSNVFLYVSHTSSLRY